MQPYPDVEKIIRQTQRYEFADGLRDIQIGLMFMTYGFVGWLIFEPAWIGFIYRLKLNFGAWAMWVAILLLLILRRWSPTWCAGGPRSSHTAVMAPERVRQTFPLGHAPPGQLDRHRPFFAGLGNQPGIKKSSLAGKMKWSGRLIWVATGLATGYTFIHFGRYLGLRHYVWVGILGRLVPLCCNCWPLTFGQSFLGLRWPGGCLFGQRPGGAAEDPESVGGTER